MPRDSRHTPKHQSTVQTQLFDSAEQAWFWFIQAQQARNDGARAMSGVGAVPRPCEPIDILQALDGLYREQNVTMEHLLVMRHYGRRMIAPDPRRAKEIRSYRLWTDAMSKLAKVLERKKITRPQGIFAAWLPHDNIVSIDTYREAAE